MLETTYTCHHRLLRVALIVLLAIALAAGSLTVALAATQSDAGARDSAIQPAGAGSTPAGDVLTAPGIQATQALTVTKRDTLVGDVDGDGQVDTGDTLEYTIVITNGSGITVTGVMLSDTIDAATSLSGTVAVSPLAMDDSYAAIGNTRVSITETNGILSNDIDLDDPVPNPPRNDDLSAVAVSGGTTAQGGDITVNADGSFMYDPPAGFEGTDSFTYTVEDSDELRDTATITFTVAETVWYIDNTAPAGGDGRQATPFNSIAAFNSAGSDSIGDTIFLYEGGGPYDGGITLSLDQQLIGQGVDLAPTAGLTPPLGTTLPATTANPILNNNSGDAVTLGLDSAAYGLTVGNTGGYAFAASGYLGTSIINSASITGTGGLLNVVTTDSGTLNATFDTLSTTGYSGDLVHLVAVNGAITATTGSITHAAAGDTISILSGGVDMTLASSITKSGGGALLDVRGGHIGDLVFNGDVSASAGTGVQGNNADGTYTFNGDFDLTGGTAGINLENGTDGSFAFLNSGASISGVNGVSVRVDGGGSLSLAGLDYDGSITHTSPTNRGIEIVQSTGPISFDGTVQVGTSDTPMTSAEAVFLSDTGSTNAISFGNLNLIAGSPGGAGARAFVSQTSGRIAVAAGSISCDGNIGADTYCFDVSDTTSDGVTFDSIRADLDDTGESGGGISLVNTTGAFTFAANNNIAGANAAGIYANNGGTLNLGTTSAGSIATGNDAAVDITNTALNVTLTDAAAYGATDHAINLDNVSGAFTATGDVTANMAAGSNAAINVVNTAAGADIDIGTSSVTINGRRTTGVFVDNAQGTIDFGSTSIPNPNSAGGYGIRVQDTSADVTFAATDISNTTQTIARADGTNDGVPDNSTYDGVGISLSNLSGSFTSNGGTIQNTADHGVDILGGTAGTVTLDGVTIQDPGVGASPPQTVASNAVSAYNLAGTLTVRDSTIHGFEHQTNSRGVRVLNVDQDFAGVTIRNTPFSNDGASLGGDDAVLVTGRGTVNGTIDIGDDTGVGGAGHRTVFENLSGEGVQVSMGNSNGAGTVDLTIENVDFQNAVNPGGFGGIDVSAVGTAVYDDIEIRGNSFSNLYQANALGFGIIHLAPFGSSSMTAIIDGNDIYGSNALPADEGRRGIYVATGDLAGETVQDLNLDINDNDINATAHEAIYLDVRGDALTSGGSGDVIITNNRIGTGTVVAQSEREAIEIRARDTALGGGSKTVNLRIENNQVRNLDGSSGDETVDIDAEDSSTINATVLGNTFESINGAADNEFEIATEDGGTTICLDLRNNIASQSGGAGTGSMLLDNSSGNTFNANYSGNSPAPTTAGTIGSTAACTQPTVSLLGAERGVRRPPTVGNRRLKQMQAGSTPADINRPRRDVIVAIISENPSVHRSVVDHALADSIHTPAPQSAPARAAHAVTTVDSILAAAVDTSHATSASLGQKHALGLAAPFVQPAPDVTVGPFDLPAGRAVTVTFQVVVDEPAPIGTTQVGNQARISADGVAETLSDDPDTPAVDDPTITQLDVEADLAVTKTDDQTEAVPGEPITYTIVATNNGPNPVGGATVTDNLSDTLTDVAWTCAADAGSSCTSSGSSDISDAVTLTAGSSVTYTVNATVDSAALGILTNTVTITETGSITDPVPANNSATDADTLTPEADLVLTKIDTPDPVMAGQPLTYTLTLTNSGPSQGWGVKVDDMLPLSYNHTGNSCGVSYSRPDPFEWVINDMPAGQVLTCVITGTVDPGVSGTITNTAFASTIAFVTDPNPDNDSLDEPTTVFDTLVDVGDATLAEGDAGTTAFTFTISRTNTTSASSVEYTTGDGTATAGSDYTAISGTVNFAAGGAPTQTVTVDVSGDTLVELDETFVVTLSNPTNAGIDDGQGVGTITNDDSTALSIDDVMVNEPDGPAVFTVTLSATSALTTSVDYATNDGSATAGADYTTVTGTLSMPAGAISGTIGVPIIDDGIDEPLTETFTVDLSAPVNATIADSQGVGTIVDDENTSPALSGVAVTSPIDENDTVTMTGQISDPDVTDSFTLTVDWGDGSVMIHTYGAGTSAFTETHRYLDDDPTGTPSDSYSLDLTLVDSEGADATDTASVTVDNVAPVVDAGADIDTIQNEVVAFTGVFTDPGTLDTHTVEWDFGDGATATGTLTPTHTYTATGTYTATLTVTDDDAGVSSDSIRVRVVPAALYLPLVMRPVALPDLVVKDLIVTGDDIEVVIENQGAGPVEDEFWVDVYIDPEPAPTRVNQTWPNLADEGLVWGVTQAALPLDPGETLTLRIGDAYYEAAQSNFSGTLPAGTPVYAQVDSANAATDYGGVLETHERDGGVYNNIAGPVFSSSTRTFDIPRQRFANTPPAEMPARPRP